MASFDKQIVRDWLSANWVHAPGGAASGPGEDAQGTPPELPADVIDRTVARYEELLARLGA